MGRATGCLFDTPHQRKMYRTALGPNGLFKASPTLRVGTSSLSEYEDPVRDQGPTGGCESASGGMATVISLRTKGAPLPWFPSEDGIYKDSRCFDRSPAANGVLPPLQDDGTTTASSMSALKFCGLRMAGPKPADGRNSDLDPATINNEPRLDELDLQAEIPILVDPAGYAIDLSDTKQAITVIQAALDADKPVRIDIIADNAFQAFFQSWTPSTPPLSSCNPNDPGAGGHAIVLTELVVKPDFSIVLAGLNSWGPVGAPPLVAAGPNLQVGHWQGDASWFTQAVQQATIWDCTRIG
jgi:hypothetical protein